MNFENFNQPTERNFSNEAMSLNGEIVQALLEATPEDRATFRTLKRFEQDFFSRE